MALFIQNLPSTGEGLSFIGGTVPTHLIPDVQAAFEKAEATDAMPSSASTFVPPHPRDFGPKDAWHLDEWTPVDVIALQWVAADLSTQQRAVIQEMVDADGAYRSTTDLLSAAGYDPDTRASGVFRSIAGRCRANGRKPFWDGKPGEGNGRLMGIVRPGIRDLLAIALDATD